MRYIEELKENDHLIGHFFCKSKQSLKSRSGKTYLSLKLQDKTGVVDAKVWEMNNDIQAFEEGEIIKIDGTVLTYQNDLQIKVNKLRQSQPGEYEPADFIPCTEKDVGQMYSQITEYVGSISHPFIKKLVKNILIDDAEVAQFLKTHTAAKNLHHGFMGGLLEHTLSVTQTCDFLSGRYKYVNRDFLIATAMLHDVGKIYELSALPANEYTDEGQMLGHIVIGAEMITAAANIIEGFPKELLNLIKHSIIAHHGEFEFGSPKLPNTLEAFLLYCADNMDAKAKAYEETIDHDRTPGPWAGYHKMLNRYVRRSDIE